MTVHVTYNIHVGTTEVKYVRIGKKELNHSGKIGSLVTLVPLPLPPVDAEVGLVFLRATEVVDLEVFFVFSLKGRICNLGFCSVPDFSAANW